MKKMKRGIALLITLLMLMSQVAFSQTVEDISEHWAAKSINMLLNMGIISGYPDGSIKPDNTITRAEFVTLVNRTFGYNEKGDRNFPDVHSGSWYYDSFSIAMKARYVVGDQNGNANPNSNITRAEVAVILAKTLNLTVSKSSSTFIDNNSIPTWALSSIIAVQENHLVSGYPDGTFKPQNNLTRAEGFMLIANVIERGLLEDDSEPEITTTPKPTPTPTTSSSGGDSGGGRPTTTPNPTPTITFTVTFNLNYDGAANPSTTQVIKDQAVIRPNDPTRDGFVFGGWYKEPSCENEYIYTEKVTSDTNLYANWYEGVTPINLSLNFISRVIETENFDLISDKDTDGDGLWDVYEIYVYSTDINKIDTDGDGLTDYEEVFITYTNPTLVDTNDNSINDAEDDTDSDGLSNIQEIEKGTSAVLEDTDGDGLTDGDEVNNYRSDPLLVDTDGDGLTDSEEVKLGLDPTKVKTDGVTYDNIRTFEQLASDEIKDEALLASDNWLTPSIFGNLAGLINNNILLEKSNNESFNSNNAIISDVIDVHTTYSESLTLMFSHSVSYAGDIKNLTIASFNDVDGLQIIDTIVDEDSMTITGKITGSGTYFVIDIDEFLSGLGIDVLGNLSEPKTTSSAALVLDDSSWIVEESTEDKLVKTFETDESGNNVEVYTNKDGEIVDRKIVHEEIVDEISEIQPASSVFMIPSTFTASAVGNLNITGKADIVFVLDTTGSMDSNIRNVGNNINSFVDKLEKTYNIDANFGVVTYNDWIDSENPAYDNSSIAGTQIHTSNSKDLFTNTNTFKQKILSIANGGTYGGDEIVLDGLGMAKDDLKWRVDSAKFVILVTDERGTSKNRYGYNDFDNIAQSYANDGIILSVITETNLYNNYRTLWETTNGLYGNIYGDFSNLLLGLADKVGEITNEGGDWVLLDDYRAVKLSCKIADIATNDTDGDGLTDEQELGVSEEKDLTWLITATLKFHFIDPAAYIGKTKLTIWHYISDPTVYNTVDEEAKNKTSPYADTDGDGLLDHSATYVGGKKVAPKDPEPTIANWGGLWKNIITDAKKSIPTQYGEYMPIELNNKMFAAAGAKLLTFKTDNKTNVFHSQVSTWQYGAGYNELYDSVFRVGTNGNISVYQNFTTDNKNAIWAWRGDYLNLGSGTEIGVYENPHTLNLTDAKKIGSSALKMVKDNALSVGWDVTKLDAELAIKIPAAELAWLTAVASEYLGFGSAADEWAEFNRLTRLAADLIVLQYQTTEKIVNGITNYSKGILDYKGTHWDSSSFTLPMTLNLYKQSSGKYNKILNWYPDSEQWWITGFNSDYLNPSVGQLVTVGSIDFTGHIDLLDKMKLRSDNSKQYTLYDEDGKTVWIIWGDYLSGIPENMQ